MMRSNTSITPVRSFNKLFNCSAHIKSIRLYSHEGLFAAELVEFSEETALSRT